MSLFKWSSEFIIFFYFQSSTIDSNFSPAPARQRADRNLPIILNEIYFCIFEHIAPPTGRLTPEQLGIFTSLSRVCRFFANFCLPRIFEFVEFSGSIFCNDTPTGYHNDAKTSREARSTLCTQIAAKQPLALALAKTVRVCHFMDGELDDMGSGAVQLFANKYTAGMLRMKNIRELKFTSSFVDTKHWDAIATLGSLEELSFDSCTFLKGPADVEPEKRVTVKVSCLRVVECGGRHQLIAAIDAQYLRTLATDDLFFHYVDWLSQSVLTELYITILRSSDPLVHLYLQRLHAIMKTHQSLEALALVVDTPYPAEDVIRITFDSPVWKELPLLRSLTLSVRFTYLYKDIRHLRCVSHMASDPYPRSLP
jgi:hypothetical protein